MRILISISIAALLACSLICTAVEQIKAGEIANFTPIAASAATLGSNKEPRLAAKRQIAEAACGLCSDTDCCGGASLGGSSVRTAARPAKRNA